MKKLLALAALAASLTTGFAQFNAPSTGVNAAMLKLFGDTKAFSAKADVRLLDKAQKEIAAFPITAALRDGKLRAELLLSEIKSEAMPAEAGTMMKQAGMDRAITIVRSDKKVTITSYPGLQSYTEVPFSATEAADEKVELTEVGKEAIGTVRRALEATGACACDSPPHALPRGCVR